MDKIIVEDITTKLPDGKERHVRILINLTELAAKFAPKIEKNVPKRARLLGLTIRAQFVKYPGEMLPLTISTAKPEEPKS